MIAELKVKATSADLMAALAKRYPAAEYALLPQVANATGAHASRHADALALSLWPSRGIVLHGFEIKVSRNDWVRELKKPDKAEPIASRCHHWWIVAPVGVVDRFELPATWGLLEYGAGTLKVVVQAPRMDPPAVDLPFVAAILRAAAGNPPGKVELDAARDAGYAAGASAGEAKAAGEVERMAESLKSTQRSVREFEEASGVRISQWSAGRIGDAVRKVLAAGDDLNAPIRQIERMRAAAETFLRMTAEDQK